MTTQGSRLLINEPPLQVLPSLALAVGLNEAIFLQQVQYWLATSKHVHDGRRWVYNSTDEWAKQFPFWSESTIKRIVASLRDSNVLLTRNDLNKHSFDRTLWYSIDYAELNNIIQTDSIVSTWNYAAGQSDTDNTNRLPETSAVEAAAAADSSPAKPNIAKYVAAYERIWGLMISSPYISDQVKEWAGRVTLDGWCYALQESADSKNAGNWKYMKRILERIERDGYQADSAPTKSESKIDFLIEDIL